MKAKVLVIVLLSLMNLSCSKEREGPKKPCYLYFVNIVNNENNCDCDSLSCSSLIFISEDEYNRLLLIYENSNNECPFVEVKESVTSNIFNGYLITIEKGNCPEFGI